MQALVVEASGPAPLAFEAEGGDGAGPCIYAAALVMAGDYVLCVTLGGAMLPGWPRVLHARPAASDAGRCWLSGATLGGVVAGAPACALERRCASKIGTQGRAHAGVQGTSRVFARTAAPPSPPAGCPQRCPAHTIVPSRLQNV